MFTLQTGLLSPESLKGSPDPAQQVANTLGHCDAALEHRGPVSFTSPVTNPADMGGFRPPRPSMERPPDRPPWQNIPFMPMPFVPYPGFSNPAYLVPGNELQQFGWMGQQPALNVPGMAHVNMAMFNNLQAFQANIQFLRMNNFQFRLAKGPVMDVYLSGGSLKVVKAEGYMLLSSDYTTEETVC